MAQFLMRVTGGPAIVRNMNTVTRDMGDHISQGLKAAGLELQRASQSLVPVEFGNLRASAYTVSRGSGFGTVVEVGYTAAYAAYVHEKIAMKLRGQDRWPSPPHQGKYWDPQGRAQAKFLEAPARALTPQMMQIIRQYAGIR